MTPHGLHAPSSVTSQQLNNRKHPKAAASTLLYITGGYIRAASCILYGYHNLTHILCHAMGERCSYATLRWHWCTQTRARAHTRLSSILDRHISALISASLCNSQQRTQKLNHRIYSWTSHLSLSNPGQAPARTRTGNLYTGSAATYMLVHKGLHDSRLLLHVMMAPSLWS